MSASRVATHSGLGTSMTMARSDTITTSEALHQNKDLVSQIIERAGTLSQEASTSRLNSGKPFTSFPSKPSSLLLQKAPLAVQTHGKKIAKIVEIIFHAIIGPKNTVNNVSVVILRSKFCMGSDAQ